jgi:hypothetical protein
MSKIGAFTLVASTGFIADIVDEGALGRDPRRAPPYVVARDLA